jgi:hypothetical protein
MAAALRSIRPPHLGRIALAAVTGLAMFGVVALAEQVAGAATLTVTNCNNSGTGSLRQTVANAAPGDAINFSLTCSTIDDPTGTILITKNLTINGPGQSVLAVSGDNVSGIFNVYSGVTVAISSLTIENTSVSNGGAIYNNGTLNVTNSTLSDNTASANGGGIYNTGALTVTNSTFSGNTASANGGGIYNNAAASLTVTHCTLSGNSASGYAGGIYNNGTVTISNSTLSGNNASAVDGAGGILNNGTVTISNTNLSGNNAPNGGAIFNWGTLTVTYSTMSSNTSSMNGGALTNGGTAFVSNSTISGNTVGLAGGGIFNGGTLTVSNSTLSGNTAGIGGGIHNHGPPGVASFSNSTVTGNVGGGILNTATLTVQATIVANSYDCYGGITDNGYNVDTDGSCGFTGSSISGYATLGKTLGPLADNGGPTQTIALLPANPAIDYVPAAACPTTDQRGLPRTAPCDIGAYDTDGLSPQAITFTSTAPTAAVVGGPTYAVTATGGASGNPVTLTVDGPSTSVCSIAGAVVSFIGIGTCTIDANQAGNAAYSAAPQVQQSFPVTKMAVTTVSLPPGSLKVRYSATLAAVGGHPPYKWSVVAGKLPNGLHLSSAGVLSGTPKKSGMFTFTVKVVDHKTKTKPHTQNTATQVLSFTIS